MMPLVVAATEAEILPSIPLLQKFKIPTLITGVGMTATAYHLGKRLAVSKPDYIINVGIAGAFPKDLPLGTVVHVPEDHLTELGAEDNLNFITIESLGFGTGSFSAQLPSGITVGLPRLSGITVNTVHGNEDTIAAVLNLYPDVSIETMEGAAVLYACTEEKIPCIPIRAISNYVEKRDKSKWNIPLAVNNLNEWLQAFLTTHFNE